MPELNKLLMWTILAMSGSWWVAPTLGQSHQVLRQPRPTVNSTQKKAVSETKQPLIKNKFRDQSSAPSSSSTMKEIDVFDIGVTKPLTIVEVEQVDHETVVDDRVIGERTVDAPAAADEGLGPNEYVVGGGGIPTGVMLENGQWVEDGAVLDDDSMMMNQYGQDGDPGPYDEYTQYVEMLGTARHDCPTGTPVSPFWVRADALFWSLDGTFVPALVTTSPSGTNRFDAGVLGFVGTQTLLGGDKLGVDGRAGARIEVGGWMPSRSLGWHVAVFGLDNAADSYQFDGGTFPILARPFFSVEPNQVGPNAELIALSGQLDGNISVSQSTSLDGVEVMMHRMLAGDRQRQLQLVAGYQHNTLEDRLSINDFKRITGSSSGLAIGTTLAERDDFQTDNRFSGGAIGVLASMQQQRLSLSGGMQMALGNNQMKVRIDGSTTSSVPVTALAREVVTTSGGLLAQQTNIGEYEQDTFAVLPQLHADIGYDLHPGLRLMIGYRFLYWSQVARVGEQIDSELNLSQLDPAGLNGSPRPRFDFQLSDFWAQGLNVGLDYRF